jgi:multisubunit Na+/H+ antiporter MnhC subunit
LCCIGPCTTLQSRKFEVPSISLTSTYEQTSDYSAKVFGFATFGKVYGLIICLAGLLNFSQSALDAATHKTFKNDPVPINVILLSLALLVGLALVAFVWHKSRNALRADIEEEAEEARETLMPGAEGVNGYGTVSPSQENRGRTL